MIPNHIYVGPLSAVVSTVEASRIGHLVTLINSDSMIDTPAGIAAGRHLRLAMNDITEALPGMVPPGESHVAELIEFATGWDRKTPMLIHCWAGISRSTAAAFVTLCALNPQAEEHRIAQAIRAASPTATPNARIVKLADAALGRGGRMTDAVMAIGPGAPVMEARVFSLPSRFTD
ncbi:MAG: tyrosine phosphatase family protein [Hyphomicrobiales bacterium]